MSTSSLEFWELTDGSSEGSRSLLPLAQALALTHHSVTVFDTGPNSAGSETPNYIALNTTDNGWRVLVDKIRCKFGRVRPFTFGCIGAPLTNKEMQLLVQQNSLNGVLVASARDAVQHFYTPEGGVVSFGSNEALATFLQKRSDVQWFETKLNSTLSLPVDTKPFALAARLLSAAQQSGLLCDRNGNVAVRMSSQDGNERFIVSPRGVNKGALLPTELCLAELESGSAVVRCMDLSRKSSIDSGVIGSVFKRLPAVKAVLHFHPGDALVVPEQQTRFPYPCGTVEEADELFAAFDRCTATSEEGSLVEMVHHGYFMTLTELGTQSLLEQWRLAKEEHTEHLRKIEKLHVLEHSKQCPILVGTKVIGIYLSHEDGWGSIYLRTCERGRRIATSLAEIVAKRGVQIGANDKCRVIEFYLRLGWTIERREGEQAYLNPPVN